MAPVVGIDFGTSNSAAAWVDESGRVRVAAIKDGVYLLPTVAWYGPQGHHLVGHAARQQIIDDPHNTVFGLKRFLGRRFGSPFVHQHMGRFAFTLIEGAGGQCAVQLGCGTKALDDIAVDIFKRLIELTKLSIGSDVTDVVVTVPAHYGFTQRSAIRRAATTAGVRVKGMINEPTAAATYFAERNKGKDGTILVFDLGGGTFDATLMTIVGGIVKVLATGGDAFLGGADFDAKIAEHLVAQFLRETGIDLNKSAVSMQRLLVAAETAKIELSKNEVAKIRVPCIAVKGDDFFDLEARLTRKEMENLVSPLVEKCLTVCNDILQRAKIDPARIDEIVFVGGMTRMPLIHTRMAGIFPFNASSNVHPDLAVVVGAALLGRGTQSLIDVNSMSIGVQLPGGVTKVLVPANSQVPSVSRLPLGERPPSDKPLVIGLFESIDATSLERDVLGTVRVEPAWLVKHTGALTLEAWLGADLDLTLALDAGDGQKLPLEIKRAVPVARAAAPAAAPAAAAGFRSVALENAKKQVTAELRDTQAAPKKDTSKEDRTSSIDGQRSLPEDDASVPKPGDVVGGYHLLDILGRGGMGRVYLAEHIRLGRRVALKMLRRRFAGNEAAIERFLTEARAINRIRHENCIEVTDLFETDDGHTCYIMEALEGRSLAELLRSVGAPRPERTVRIAYQVSSAMVAVHDASIIHRDLKPENIFLTHRGGRDDFVKLLDFGVAKLTDPSAASTTESTIGVAIGTLEYMSPEQLIGQPIDPRADIFALGVVLYECITGRLPFAGQTEREILFSQLSTDPPRPSTLVSADHPIPRELDELILQCLDREPSRRPQTMREVRGRLESVLEELVSLRDRDDTAAKNDLPLPGAPPSEGDGLGNPFASIPSTGPFGAGPTVPLELSPGGGPIRPIVSGEAVLAATPPPSDPPPAITMPRTVPDPPPTPTALPAPAAAPPRTAPQPSAAPEPTSPLPDRVVVKHVGVPGWAVVALVALTATVASLGTLLYLRGL
ncbi:MAG: Hsp70 family protein [Deltaproteobacteria bacterium]|nr:Hsp70 family protein [Deltaproteobacteria bacterium]